MQTRGPFFGPESERQARRQLEGTERVALLPSAAFLAVTVASEPGDPVVVFIGWSDAITEHAYPGTAIWQAAIRSFLASPSTGDYAEPIVRKAAAESLERFPSLERWLAWYDHERQARGERRRRSGESAPSWNPLFWIG